MTSNHPATAIDHGASGSGSAFDDLLNQNTSVFNFIRFHSAGAREEIPAHIVAELPAALLIDLFEGISLLHHIAESSPPRPAWLRRSYQTTEAELRKRCVSGAPDKEYS